MCVRESVNMDNTDEVLKKPTPTPSPGVISAGTNSSTTANGSNKIIGRNANGTMVVTSAPANEAELQLYRVMQKASLLAYYDTLLEMGGDDVQQLCDAGNEEFLEIMALVGMASKPLHVRRLQKALQEWVTNPSLFQLPITSKINPTDGLFMPCNPRLPVHQPIPLALPINVSSPESRPAYSPSPGAPENSCESNSSAINLSPVQTADRSLSKMPNSPPVPTTRSFSPQNTSTTSPISTSSNNLSPILNEVQLQKLANAAEKLSKHLPQLEPKPQNAKKKMCKDLELVMIMPESDSRRMDEIRKYAAIYGRFDCKRKPEKPLTLHEVMVNEAAAQMCRFVPALLTRRDELFPLARQVVRHAGLHYSKHMPIPLSECSSEDEGATQNKRSRSQDEESGHIIASPEAASKINSSSWWAGVAGTGCGIKAESDDADSRCSHSSSPPTMDNECINRVSTATAAGIQVIASRGDSIIAVTNPAFVQHTRATK